MPDYSFVINSTYKPFTLQEMLTPFQMYGEAFNKAEEQAIELQKNADEFSYLAETLPEGSKARTLYEGFANDLRGYSEDLSNNGLSSYSRRGIATMRRRYSSEIGRLKKADDALVEEKKRRAALSSTDPTMLYATDNLSIDDFLDRREPNKYNVSGQKLYERGVQIGAANSSRIYSDPKVQQLTAEYNDIIQRNGYSPDVVAAFQKDLATIPELQRSVEGTLKEYGATDNLTGANYERARQSVINGIVNGIIYKRTDTMSQNPDYVTEYQKQQLAMSQDELDLKAAASGYKKVNGQWVLDSSLIAPKNTTSRSSSRGGSSTGGSKNTTYTSVPNAAYVITWNTKSSDLDNYGKDKNLDTDIAALPAGNSISSLLSEDGADYTTTEYNEEDGLKGQAYTYEDLPYDVKIVARMHMAQDDVPEHYLFYYRPYKDNWFLTGDDKPQLTIIHNPTGQVVDEGETDFSALYGSTGDGTQEEQSTETRAPNPLNYIDSTQNPIIESLNRVYGKNIGLKPITSIVPTIP